MSFPFFPSQKESLVYIFPVLFQLLVFVFNKILPPVNCTQDTGHSILPIPVIPQFTIDNSSPLRNSSCKQTWILEIYGKQKLFPSTNSIYNVLQQVTFLLGTLTFVLCTVSQLPTICLNTGTGCIGYLYLYLQSNIYVYIVVETHGTRHWHDSPVF